MVLFVMTTVIMCKYVQECFHQANTDETVCDDNGIFKGH